MTHDTFFYLVWSRHRLCSGREMHCRDKCQGRTGNDEPLSGHRYLINTCRFWTLECASRSASTMLIVWPENIVRRMFAGQDAGNSQSEDSIRSCPQPTIHCRSDSNCPFGQICGQGPENSIRSCEDGCHFSNDCPIGKVRNISGWLIIIIVRIFARLSPTH